MNKKQHNDALERQSDAVLQGLLEDRYCEHCESDNAVGLFYSHEETDNFVDRFLCDDCYWLEGYWLKEGWWRTHIEEVEEA